MMIIIFFIKLVTVLLISLTMTILNSSNILNSIDNDNNNNKNNNNNNNNKNKNNNNNNKYY